MISVITTYCANIIQPSLLAVLLFLSVRLLIRNKDSMPVVFLTFTYALWLFSDIYWLVYDFLRPDSRMPFAANEFGEAGIFLMIAAIINSAVPRGRVSKKLTTGVFAFSICNIVLWLLWSGEWFQDILIGLVFIYVLYSAVCSLKSVQAISKKEWVFLVVICILLIAGQFTTFLVDKPFKIFVDMGCYVLLFTGELFWIVRYFIAGSKKDAPLKSLSISVAGVVWSTTALFMSEGIIYNVFIIMEALILIFMYLSVRKVVKDK